MKRVVIILSLVMISILTISLGTAFGHEGEGGPISITLCNTINGKTQDPVYDALCNDWPPPPGLPIPWEPLP